MLVCIISHIYIFIYPHSCYAAYIAYYDYYYYSFAEGYRLNGAATTVERTLHDDNHRATRSLVYVTIVLLGTRCPIEYSVRIPRM